MISIPFMEFIYAHVIKIFFYIFHFNFLKHKKITERDAVDGTSSINAFFFTHSFRFASQLLLVFFFITSQKNKIFLLCFLLALFASNIIIIFLLLLLLLKSSGMKTLSDHFVRFFS